MKNKITYLLFLFINIIYAQEDSLQYTTNIPNDSIKNVNVSGGKLEAPLFSKAKDSIWHDFKQRKSYLINQAEVEYKTDKINSGRIVIDWNTNHIEAYGIKDSIGKLSQHPLIIQDGKEIEATALKFNMKNKHGIIYGVKTTEGEGVIYAEKLKNHGDSLAYLRNGWFTTDPLYKNKKDSIPDYFIKANKMKYYRDDKIITGPAQMYIENIPTPLIAPFGYFPTSKATSVSGIIIPSWGGTNEDLGFGLLKGGYYWSINEYLNALLTADIYTKGSWGLHFKSQYKKRYKFNGQFSIDYENRISGVKGLDTYTKQKISSVLWSHRQDPKANPNLTFGASVNYSSSQYFKNSLDQNNIIGGGFLTNNIQSSISLQKQFDNLPFNIALSASHNQNNNTKAINLTLPKLTINMDRLYPFASKSGSKKGLIQNIGVNYNLNTEARVSETEETFLKEPYFKQAKTGLKHTANLSTSTSIFKNFNTSISANYDEVWYLNSLERTYDTDTNSLIDTDIDGFKTFRQYSASLGVSTTLYNLKKFNKGKIAAIRHRVTPSVSYSYRPDFSSDKYDYFGYYIDSNGEEVKYSKFENGIYGSPSSSMSSSLNFSLLNNVEAKIRSSNDSVDLKKISILDQFSINTSYNMAADSLKWSPITMSGSTSLFNKKMNINFGGIVDVYSYNPETNQTLDKFGKFSLSSIRLATGYNFSNRTFQKKGDKNKKTYPYRGDHRYEKFKFNKDGYANFSMPWKLNTSINYNYNFRTGSKILTTTLSGDVEFSPHWKIGATSGYDFINKEFAFTRIKLQRDLRSFSFNFDWVPFGERKTYYFMIGIKANILKDLKYDQRQFPESGNSF